MELRPIQQSAGMAGAAKAVPPGATSVQPAGGVVQLPPGTRLDAIKLSGNDLVVTLPDGQILVIIDGALQIPQLKIGPINIPAPTIAALIAGQEPEPAAGAPQSSGGNFEQTPGNIGDPFGLGDLLPPTDFSLSNPEARELIPNAIDDEPEILITTPDQPAGATSATATVAEAALQVCPLLDLADEPRVPADSAVEQEVATVHRSGADVSDSVPSDEVLRRGAPAARQDLQGGGDDPPHGAHHRRVEVEAQAIRLCGAEP